ncbi:MAG TPA: SagB family peptide dehydrogenase [Chitinophaga sp.]|uniref:SagB family peptide dehydrogenase n=1 Tax=Chitinophaga sp. TaxID=1869181 RepID=UPI002CA32379|nr:SagB family peptide dehydrogenase [Chitinophaga sp.]HVI43738.1 SagB family peptide dehydrogenase [Chitinophaga sp.]
METPAASDSRLIRRAFSLLQYWKDGSMTIENYLTGTSLTANLLVLDILSAATNPVYSHELSNRFLHIPAINDIIHQMIRLNLLLIAGSRREQHDRRLEENWKWDLNAKYFHYGTASVKYNFDQEEVRRQLEKKAVTHPPPSPFKTSDNTTKIKLDDPFLPPVDFWDVLLRRRTCRNFKDTPISKSAFSSFVKLVAGYSRFYDDAKIDKRVIKTSPSGGARHPVELYAFVKNVESIEPAVYHYEVETNALTFVNHLPARKQLLDFFSGQHWVSNAAVTFIFTAMVQRSMWKYDHSRAYRVLLLDCGHLGQTFHLSATALQLGVFTTAAIQDKKIEKFLKIDGIQEIVLYGGAIGMAG